MQVTASPLAYAAAAVAFWATVATAFKLALQYLSPLQLVFLASLVSSLALGLLLLARGGARSLIPARNELTRAMGLGLLNPLLYYLVLFEAYDRLRAQEAMAINYSWPAMLVLLSAVFLGQRVKPRPWGALALAYLGVLVIASNGQLAALNFDDSAGVLLALLSTLLWAAFWLLRMRLPGDATCGLFFGFAAATPLLAILVWLFDPIATLPWQAWAGAVYVGLFEMGITFVLWNTGLKLAHERGEVARVSALIYCTPFLSLLLIALVLKEPLQASALVGLVLIVAGMWLARSRPGAAA